jgi:hypothetical protein
MRRAIWATTLVVLAAACTGDNPTVASPLASSSGSQNPSIEPVGVPSGTPPSYKRDLDAASLPARALVPPGTEPTDVWPAISPDGTQFALIAFAAKGGDPLRRARGLVLWRRFDDAPAWRAVYGVSDRREAGVLDIHALIGDATGDDSPDAITFEDTGGSGGCGAWRVLDLAANADVFTRETCDTSIDFSPDPVDPASGWTVASSAEQPT